MLLRPPRSTRTDTLCPDTTLLRSTNMIPACAGCGWTWEKARCDRPTLGAPARTRALSGQRPLQEARNVDYFFRTYRMGHCVRSEEHTSELQSLMRISYAVLCLKKKTVLTPDTNSKLTISLLL